MLLDCIGFCVVLSTSQLWLFPFFSTPSSFHFVHMCRPSASERKEAESAGIRANSRIIRAHGLGDL